MAGNDDIVAPTGEPDFAQSLQGFASMCESSGRTGGMSPEDCDMVAGKLRDACFLIDTLQKLRDGKIALGWQLVPATALAEQAATIERLTKERDEATVAGWKAAHDCILYAEANNYGPRSTPYTAADLAELLRTEAPGDYLQIEWRTATQAAEAEARAETAERDLAEARAEVERLRKVVKTASAPGSRPLRRRRIKSNS